MLFYVGEVFALFKPDIPRRTAFLVFEVFVPADAGAEGQVEGHRLGEDPVLRHAELLDKQGAVLVGELAVNARAHRQLPLALCEHGGHLLAQIVVGAVLHVGEEHVGIARDLHGGGLQDALLFEQQRQEVADELGREHDLLAAVDLKAQVRRDPVQRDDRKLLNRRAPEEGDDVRLPVPEEGEGLVYVDDLGEEQVLDVAEELLAHQLVHLADLLEVQHVHAVCAQLLADALPDALHQDLLLARNAQDLVDLGLGRHAGQRVAHVGRQDGAVRQDADAHPVELRQVRLIDHQELEPLQKRHGGVGGLEQHTLIEGKPAQLAVDVDAFCRGLALLGGFLFGKRLPLLGGPALGGFLLFLGRLLLSGALLFRGAFLFGGALLLGRGLFLFLRHETILLIDAGPACVSLGFPYLLLFYDISPGKSTQELCSFHTCGRL